ncbi:hypothetical protein KIL84_002255 [Mauremys mutica]|uniref:Uncharacterized protein n=1 Tax=Mauremys mutica TaxID=74926 RepID=A0A9D3X6F4_9SAUR|nr:hypothetical protein KIL84_002255 [Mauremys mutica]
MPQKLLGGWPSPGLKLLVAGWQHLGEGRQLPAEVKEPHFCPFEHSGDLSHARKLPLFPSPINPPTISPRTLLLSLVRTGPAVPLHPPPPVPAKASEDGSSSWL